VQKKKIGFERIQILVISLIFYIFHADTTVILRSSTSLLIIRLIIRLQYYTGNEFKVKYFFLENTI